MQQDYLYDVFLSYVDTAGGSSAALEHCRRWTRELLLPVLEDELQHVGLEAPRVFHDRALPVGTEWPSALREALLRSRTMLAVLCPPYFRAEAAWCRWELGSMLARSQACGVDLVYGVVYRDGDHFPPAARERLWDDFSDHNCLPVDGTPRVPETFRRRVMKVAERLGEMCRSAPRWQPDFPLAPLPPVPVLPRHRVLS